MVEAELDSPVDWHASFGDPRADYTPDDHDIDAAKTRTVDGVGVRGDVPEDVARSVLSGKGREAVTSIGGEVTVGDLRDNVVDDMIDELDGEAGGMAGALAEGVLNMASDGDAGLSRKVEHRERGLLTDEVELQRRLDAVTAVADAVDRTSVSTDQPDASGK